MTGAVSASFSPAAKAMQRAYNTDPRSTCLFFQDPPQSIFESHKPDQDPVVTPTLNTLSQAPFASGISNCDFIVPGDIFFEENPLIAANIRLSTQQKYILALSNFLDSHAAQQRTLLSLDQRLALYIQDQYLKNSRPGRRQEMSNLICMLLLELPMLKSQLGLARKCISGWRHLKPSSSSAPLTKDMVLAFAWHLISTKKTEAAAVLLLSYAGLLRASEALKLEWSQVALPGDIRLSSYGSNVAGVNIVDSKTSRSTGRFQFVPIFDNDIVNLLMQYKSANSNQQLFAPKLGYASYQASFKSAASNYKIGNAKFTTHSARIGKAIEDYLEGLPVSQIAINGRWKSLNSLRYYLDNGKSWLLNLSIPSEQQHRIRADANRLKALLQRS